MCPLCWEQHRESLRASSWLSALPLATRAVLAVLAVPYTAPLQEALSPPQERVWFSWKRAWVLAAVASYLDGGEEGLRCWMFDLVVKEVLLAHSGHRQEDKCVSGELPNYNKQSGALPFSAPGFRLYCLQA